MTHLLSYLFHVLQAKLKSADVFTVRYRRAKINRSRKQEPEADLNAQTNLDEGLLCMFRLLNQFHK